MRWLPLVVVGVGVLVGCGEMTPGGTTGQATSTGTLNGAPFSAVDSTVNLSVPTTTVNIWSTLFSMSAPQISGSMTTLLVSDQTNTCGTFDQPSSAVEFAAGLFDADETGHATPVTAPGTYAVLNPTFGLGQTPTVGKTVFVLAATCDPTKGYWGAIGDGGTITISSVTSSGLVGTFDIHFNDGSITTGTFTAASCPATITDKLCNH